MCPRRMALWGVSAGRHTKVRRQEVIKKGRKDLLWWTLLCIYYNFGATGNYTMGEPANSVNKMTHYLESAIKHSSLYS